jgi:hypothetical protein
MAEMLLSSVPREVRDAVIRNSGSSINFITNVEIRDAFIRSITRTRHLFAEIAPDIQVPDMDDLEQAEVDFVKLSRVWEALEKGKLEPELVLGPVNLSLTSWRKIYSSLRAWQDINDPQSPSKLQRQQGGDGLWVLEYIEYHYEKIIGDDLRSREGARIPMKGGGAVSGDGEAIWRIAVIPGADTGGNSLTGYSLEMIPPEGHVPIGHYLTLQAGRIFLKKNPVDLAGYTKLGVQHKAAGEKAAWIPQGNFGPTNGQVYLFGNEVAVSRNPGAGGTGSRVPVWG